MTRLKWPQGWIIENLISSEDTPVRPFTFWYATSSEICCCWCCSVSGRVEFLNLIFQWIHMSKPDLARFDCLRNDLVLVCCFADCSALISMTLVTCPSQVLMLTSYIFQAVSSIYTSPFRCLWECCCRNRETRLSSAALILFWLLTRVWRIVARALFPESKHPPCWIRES